MRYHVLSFSAPAKRRPNNDNRLTFEERNIVDWFIANTQGLHVVHWVRATITGYRIMTPRGVWCTIRRYDGCLYGSGSNFWLRHGINASVVPHWYYLVVEDTAKLSGTRDILKFAAGPRHGGYEELQLLFRTAALNHEYPGPLQELQPETHTVLEKDLKAA